MMKFAFELVPDLATHIAPHHRFKMSIIKDGVEIPNAGGGDSYCYNAMVLPGRPIAATGREVSHDFEPDLRSINGVDGVEVETPIVVGEDFDDLVVRIDNNLILSQEILQSFYSLRCHVDGRTFLFPLKSPLFRVNWDGLGIFHIDVGFICRTVAKERTA